jgi:hypothetical protein
VKRKQSEMERGNTLSHGTTARREGTGVCVCVRARARAPGCVWGLGGWDHQRSGHAKKKEETKAQRASSRDRAGGVTTACVRACCLLDAGCGLLRIVLPELHVERDAARFRGTERSLCNSVAAIAVDSSGSSRREQACDKEEVMRRGRCDTGKTLGARRGGGSLRRQDRWSTAPPVMRARLPPEKDNGPMCDA